MRLAGRDAGAIDLAALHGLPLRTRTAIVMPVYNEDTRRVEAGLKSIWGSLSSEPEEAAFDLFILSDTSDAAIAAEEEHMWERLVARFGASGRLFYRRRTERKGHKAGNIAEFVEHRASGYECMIVLDADSIMSGAALVTLARAMEAHPRIGILQSLPLAVGRETLFGRLIQFSSRLQSPMLGSGLAFWQLGESNYWGHNAILRLAPFAQHCGLPHLSGAPPFGGAILSHDFVEAAFMRRAGYEVRQVPELEGSWEEVPANILDYAARDRRWAQGNLQHLRLLGERGLHPLSRIHLLTGIMSYASSPMWLTLLLLSSVLSIIESAKRPQYFLAGFRTLFPAWPQFHNDETLALISFTLLVLMLPKVLGALLAIRDPALRRKFGGTVRLGASLFLEQVFSVLLAPPMMLFHATFVMQILLGKGVAWGGQERGERGVHLQGGAAAPEVAAAGGNRVGRAHLMARAALLLVADPGARRSSVRRGPDRVDQPCGRRSHRAAPRAVPDPGGDRSAAGTPEPLFAGRGVTARACANCAVAPGRCRCAGPAPLTADVKPHTSVRWTFCV